MRRIEKLESETTAKQTNLETLRREKVELENTLEQEQEALVNKLWKRMDQLETEKRYVHITHVIYCPFATFYVFSGPFKVRWTPRKRPRQSLQWWFCLQLHR